MIDSPFTLDICGFKNLVKSVNHWITYTGDLLSGEGL